MAHSLEKGGARPVSASDFNERVKRLLASKPETQTVEKRPKDKRQFGRSGPRM